MKEERANPITECSHKKVLNTFVLLIIAYFRQKEKEKLHLLLGVGYK